MWKPSAVEDRVCVVGGGPAGAAAAIGLALRGVPVILGVRPRRREVPMGESLPPAVLPLLAELGVLDAFLRGPHLECYANEAVWGRDDRRFRSFMSVPPGHGWHIDRAVFEAALIGVARDAGAEVVPAEELPARRRFTVDATG